MLRRMNWLPTYRLRCALLLWMTDGLVRNVPCHMYMPSTFSDGLVSDQRALGAQHTAFRAVSALVKEPRPDPLPPLSLL